MSDCIFCKMVNGEIKPEVVLETEDVLVFRDTMPQAPTHVLVIPKRHISTLNDLEPDDAELLGKMHLAAKQVAADEGLAEPGYRTVMNCNQDGGQTVFHIHLHLLGGRQMAWPAG